MIFKVEDTGIGISKDKQERIFDEYYQVDKSTTRNYGGTGLGLSICKKLTDLMNGNISIETNKYNGTTFTVTIPYTIPEKTTVKDFEQQKIIHSPYDG